MSCKKLKKGRPKRFRKGNLVKLSIPKLSLCRDMTSISMWNKHPEFDHEINSYTWKGFPKVIGNMLKNKLYVVVFVHNFPHPSKDQYCFLFGNGEKGWVNSQNLEKIS